MGGSRRQQIGLILGPVLFLLADRRLIPCK